MFGISLHVRPCLSVRRLRLPTGRRDAQREDKRAGRRQPDPGRIRVARPAGRDSSIMVNDEGSPLPIGQVARRAGVHVQTVRYYERRGLIAPPARAMCQVRRIGLPADRHVIRYRYR